MKLPEFTQSETHDILNAVVAILTEKGENELTAGNQRTIQALKTHIFPTDIADEALTPAIAEGLTACATDEDRAKMTSLIFSLMPLTTNQPTKQGMETLKEVLAASGLDQFDQLDLTNLDRLVNHEVQQMRFCLFRKVFKEVFHISMLEGFYATIKFGMGFGEDKETAEKYRRFAEMPPGSFGQALTQYYLDNQFAFPGERGSPSELTHVHDCHHVLFNWNTTIEGEFGVSSCEAGANPDPLYAYLWMGMIVGNAGYDLVPDSKPFLDRYDPEITFSQIKRGSQIAPELMTITSFYPYMEQPLEELRAKWKIPPGGNVKPGDKWCGPDGPNPYKEYEMHHAIILPETDKNLVAISITGKLTEEDLKTFEDLFRISHERYGKLNLLLRLQRFDGWENPKTFFQDFKTWWDLSGNFQRVAVLGDKLWERLLIELDRPFSAMMGMDLRYFDISDKNKALAFCRTGQT